jgi:hypothetical protein
MNTRETIEVLKRRIKSVALMLGPAMERTRSSRWKSDLTEIPQRELHGGSK